MKLKSLTDNFIRELLMQYNSVDNNGLNFKIQKLFNTFNDFSNQHDTHIKVAALNEIYSTSIINIKPVVKSICLNSPKDISTYNLDDFAKLVDLFSKSQYGDKERTNLSFASKYVHFLSERKIPIYDSYIWILIKAYYAQKYAQKLSIGKPKNYYEFYIFFNKFLKEFNLENYSIYEVDKFLWQYANNILIEIKNTNKNLSGRHELVKEFKNNLRQYLQ